MTRETLDALPSRSDVWAIARTVPAVVMNKYDVGGSEMFSQSFRQVYGSTDAERAYTIDGMDVTWAGGEGFVISYLDAHMFQEVNFQTASGSAESAKGGLITNMVTKTGTNRFLGSYNFTGGGENTSWNNLSGKTARRPAGGGAAARAGRPTPISCRARRRWASSTTRCRCPGRSSRTGCGSRSPDRSPRWSSTGSGSYNLDGTRAHGQEPDAQYLDQGVVAGAARQPAALPLQLQQQGAVQPDREHRADHRLHRQRRDRFTR